MHLFPVVRRGLLFMRLLIMRLLRLDQPRFSPPRVYVCLIGLSWISLLGCQREEQIRQYQVEKLDSIQLLESPAESTTPRGEPTDRMLAAMILVDKQAWFIKGTGKIDQFQEPIEKQFEELLASIRFAGDKPSWTLPSGWSEEAGSGMRFANIVVGSIQFSVIPLPLPEGNERDYQLSNVNRWRGQLQLPPVDSVGLARVTNQIQSADGRPIVLGDFSGWLADSGMSGGPMSGGPMAGGGPRPAPLGPSPANSDSKSPQGGRNEAGLSYQVPSGWEEIPASGMRLAAFRVQQGERTAECTIMTGIQGGFLANVNRWRDQVGLSPVATEEELGAESLQIAGDPARFVKVMGKDQGTLGLVLTRTDGTWFVKLMGDVTLVESQVDAFRQLLSSLQFSR